MDLNPVTLVDVNGFFMDSNGFELILMISFSNLVVI